jgi:cytochrome c nitrite reductase small subunit
MARGSGRLAAGIVLGGLAGILAGIGGFTFVYADGASYLTNDPAACANCHVMSDHYAAWTKSSHHAVATCNDCHAPHDFFGKYWTKARNGFNHSWAFTMESFHEPIRITPINRAVTEGACRHCHEEIVHAIDPIARREAMSCIRCHPNVGHLH